MAEAANTPTALRVDEESQRVELPCIRNQPTARPISRQGATLTADITEACMPPRTFASKAVCLAFHRSPVHTSPWRPQALCNVRSEGCAATQAEGGADVDGRRVRAAAKKQIEANR
eukprot:CAMPEP_0177345276 /NCGR_PEP_ID=MMETSP0368-20130122/28559_1 /TAXON_ID=447022 ORGANISM="Scrippsiella hangoei-like, Strain SHHI-4" /NCGR_SAMPLE_ID=MMETSP0368 /ASSEMBLY_ACC=CAM_ASM_000363 /LENGTH=115 /DNA_ID=CAMNT_0018806837 /DNA_START=230 /DNA_END=573 /DNA_ORIENTATION=-